MRPLWLAIAAALLAAAGLVPIPAGAAPSTSVSITCGSAPAGSDVPCTVTRISGGGKGVYVLFQTADGTAKAGIDYTAVKQLLYFKGGQLTASVAVHSFANQSALGSTLTFSAYVAGDLSGASGATGSIIEAPAPPPAPSPTGSWMPAPLTIGGYAFLKNQGPCCTGLIVKIVDGGMTNDADPALRQHWWAYVYYTDPSGNFPATNPYWASAWITGFDEGLQGVGPAP